MTRRIVVATETTTLADGGELLLRLVRWLQAAGLDVDGLSGSAAAVHSNVTASAA